MHKTNITREGVLAVGILIALFLLIVFLPLVSPPQPVTPATPPVATPTAIPQFHIRTPAEQEILNELLSIGRDWKYLVLNTPNQWNFWKGHEDDPMGVFYKIWDFQDETAYSIRFEHNLATEFILWDTDGDGRVDEISNGLGLVPKSALEEMLFVSNSDNWSISRPADTAPPSYVGTAFIYADRIVKAIRAVEAWPPAIALIR